MSDPTDDFGGLCVRPGKDRPWQEGDEFTFYPAGPLQPVDDSPPVKFLVPHQDEAEGSADA